MSVGGAASGEADMVAPSRDDPLVAALSEVVGGPAGRRVRPGQCAVVLLVLVAFTAAAAAFGLLLKVHCRSTAWGAPNPDQYVHLCYTDIPLLYAPRGIAAGEPPYFSAVPEDSQVEYPVLTGAAMWFTGLFVDDVDDAAHRRQYFDVNVLLLAACAVATVIATALTAGRRPWDAAMVALAPGIVVAGTINWDLLAVALTAGAMLAWARSRPMLAGALLGLGAAAKFYPLLLLGPLLLLCLRARRLPAFAATLGAAVTAWAVVNVPVMILAPEGWSRFYRLSNERGEGFGSVWYALSLLDAGVPYERLDPVAAGLFLLCCLAIAALALLAPRRPRFAQLAFLVLAAFLVTNKVYSPQYVVWLVPLAVLARPRWRDFLVWQGAEVLHWAGTWLYLAGYTVGRYDRALPPGGYVAVVGLHVAATLWFAALVVRDVWAPRHDVVRADGSDDPGGGVLDGAPDDPAWSRAGLRSRRQASGGLTVDELVERP